MKKTYISPDVKVFEAHIRNVILDGSPNNTMGVNGDYDSETVTIGSRKDTFWDDEEEY